MASLYRRGKTWYFAFYNSEGQRFYRSTGQTVKKNALNWLRQNNVTETIRSGHTDEELIDLWLTELKTLGRSYEHLLHLRKSLDYLGTKSSQANLKLGRMSRSDQTVRSYYRAAKQWGRWCYQNNHKQKDPMSTLKLPTRKTGRVYVRGVFTRDEATQLKDHRLLYDLALSTGLRLSELRRLTNENKRIIQGRTCLWLKPSDTKNRFEDILPIQEELWNKLDLPLWVPSKSWAAKYLRKDLEFLGIPVEDADGHRRDFHSLRGTFCDLLIQDGYPIPTVARLMRHSDGGGLLLKRYAGCSLEPFKLYLAS